MLQKILTLNRLIHVIGLYEKVYDKDLTLPFQTDMSGNIREFCLASNSPIVSFLNIEDAIDQLLTLIDRYEG
jgi:hypothetical protein